MMFLFQNCWVCYPFFLWFEGGYNGDKAEDWLGLSCKVIRLICIVENAENCGGNGAKLWRSIRRTLLFFYFEKGYLQSCLFDNH